jgi:hypothetical protein
MRRTWLYAVMVIVALSLLVSTGSFSAASTDRSVNVGVSPDPIAILGITEGGSAVNEQSASDGGGQPPRVGERFTVFTLHDNFEQDVEIQAIRATSGPVSVVDGEPVWGEVRVICEKAGSGDARFYIEAGGDGIHVEKWKTVRVTCLPEEANGNETATPTTSD